MKSNNFHATYARYKAGIERHLATLIKEASPVSIYEPMRYVLSAGGKRVRAVLVLLSCEAVGGKTKHALHAASAIEILHNFTLVHDDVMDNSPLRRGMPTVHKKWNTNTAILAGDEMAAYAYHSLLLAKSQAMQKILVTFTDALVQVCEGQGFDIEFETRDDVTIKEYLNMIGKKTARVISASCEMGALAGGGTKAEVAALKTFGESLGLAFQIQDDVLDIAGTEQQLGKPIGGDVLEGKKTYILLNALERARGNDKKILERVVRKQNVTPALIPQALEIYRRTGALHTAQEQVRQYTNKAQRALSKLKPGNARDMLSWLALQLLERNS